MTVTGKNENIECENTQQEEEGPGTHQTGETNTTDKDQHDEGHSLEEVRTQEQLSQHEDDGEEDCESGLWGHSPLSSSNREGLFPSWTGCSSLSGLSQCQDQTVSQCRSSGLQGCWSVIITFS